MPKQTKGPWIPHVTDGGHLVVGPDGYAVCALPCIVRGVDSDEFDAALEEAETLLALLAESGVTVGEVS